MAGLEPNHYTLSGNGPLQVIYASTGLGGQPQLTYQDPPLSLQFSGGDIQQVWPPLNKTSMLAVPDQGADQERCHDEGCRRCGFRLISAILT